MAKKTVTSVSLSDDARDQINDNFTELYDAAGATTTASAAELNILDGVTTTTAELNTLDGAVANVTLTATPASGTCAVQFVFKDAASVAMTAPTAGIMYFSSTADGLTRATVTSLAVLTNGSIEAVVATKLYHYVTTAAGLLGVTITASAGDYYPVFVMPNGSLEIGTVCTVNA